MRLVSLDETKRPLSEASFPIKKEVLEEMCRIMKANSGIGLAAPQVGYYQTFFIGDLGKGRFVCANPKMYVNSRKVKVYRHEEGCLTVPGERRWVERFDKVRLRGFNEDGKSFDWTCIGKLAALVQHEMDHLKGRCIVDEIQKEEGTAESAD